MQDDLLGQLMRLGMRRLASGVSILSARWVDGEAFVMTVSSVTSVSDNPASLLVCVNNHIPRYEELLKSGTPFVINVLTPKQTAISDLCAGRYQEQDRLGLGAWKEEESWLFLEDSQVSFCCRTDKTLSYGTHEIVIGRIETVKIHLSEVNPLVYCNGQYGVFAPND